MAATRNERASTVRPTRGDDLRAATAQPEDTRSKQAQAARRLPAGQGVEDEDADRRSQGDLQAACIDHRDHQRRPEGPPGLTRFRVRGLERVNSVLLLSVLTYNLLRAIAIAPQVMLLSTA